MKTRRSITNEEIIGKTEGGEKLEECKRVPRSPIIRTLRSRVITSDNEDEVQSSKRTTKRRLSRGSSKDDKSMRTENDEIVASKIDGDNVSQSPKSGKKRFSGQKLFKISEISEENEAVDVKVEIENSDSQAENPESVPVNINEMKQESETSDSNDLVKEVGENSNEEGKDKLIKELPETSDVVGREDMPMKEEPESSDDEIREDTLIKEQSEKRISHSLKLRKSSFGFVETPIEDTPEGSSSSDSSTKKSAEGIEDGYQSEDEGSNTDSKTTEEMSIDFSKDQMMKVTEVTIKKEEPSDEVTEDTSSNGSSMKKLAETEAVLENSIKSESEGSESDDEMSAAASVDSRENQINKAMVMTAQAIRKERAQEERRRSLSTPKKEPIENTGEETSSSSDGSVEKSLKIEVKEEIKEEDEESDSDEDMPEAISFDTGKDQTNRALTMAAEAIEREKARRKEHQKKRMEVIMSQKEEKERKRREKMKRLEASLPDAPAIPTIRPSEPKRKADIKEEPLEEGVKEEIKEEDEESDSDEDMPEAISFDTGKDQTNRALTMAAEAIEREKARRKEHQKKRMEVIMSQKEEKERKRREKLKRLEASLPPRLNDDLINRLPDAPAIPTIRPSEPKWKADIKEEPLEEGEAEVEVPAAKKKKKIMKFDDYLPLDNMEGATVFGVVPLEVVNQIPKSASEKAAEFKEQMLFGNRIRRESSKSLLSYKEKISATDKSRQMNKQPRFK